MDSRNAIEVRNVYKKFKIEYDKSNTLKEKMIFWKKGKIEYHEVLKDISLNIKKGETVALIGTNGSGKSTLLKLMTRIIFPNSGTIEKDGKLTSLLELGAGFHPDFTGRENIYFNASIFGLTRKEIDNRINEIIDFSELGEFIDNPIRTYSSGMYMRLAFSVAINVDADILLIDEILAVGDQHFQDKCYRKLEELRDSGKTIVIVTHSLDVVKKLCHRAIWIYKGEFRLDGDPVYVIDEYLKQVALDHKEEKKKEIEKGGHPYKGVVFIDRPKDVAKISKTREKLFIGGWQITDSDTAELNVYFDNELIKVKRVSREDVYDAYLESYPGSLNPETIGWEGEVILKDKKLGKHRIYVNCVEPDGYKLSEKEIEIDIGEEE